jgi:hypothetical protein
MKRALPRATILFLVSAFALALVTTTACARSYGYRHYHHFGFYGLRFSFNNYTSRAGLVKILGN